MSHPRVEEVSDSDLDAASDPEEGDIDDFLDSDIIRRVPDAQPRSQPRAVPPAAAQSHMLNPANLPPTAGLASADD
ncbi:Signal recognition particle protein Sec65, partial [Tolypocladium paradoxum]